MSILESGINLDGLRLMGLGRIPACASCPRYRDLVVAYQRPVEGGSALAAVPKSCLHAYCAPLARRYGVQPARSRTVLELHAATRAS